MYWTAPTAAIILRLTRGVEPKPYGGRQVVSPLHQSFSPSVLVTGETLQLHLPV